MVEEEKEPEICMKRNHELRTISVYGATGFVGSNFLEKTSFPTIPIPRDQRAPESNEVLYLIGTIHNYNVFDNAHLDIDTNLTILVDTLEAIRKYDPNTTFNFVSTWFVYGNNELPFSEDQNCKPNGFYSITKYAAELLIRSYCETYSMNYRIIRLGNVIGFGDKKASLKKNAIQHLAQKIILGEDIEMYEGGNVMRDLLHVDDVVKGIELIVEKAEVNEIYNLASGQSIVLGELLSQLKFLANSNSILKSIETPRFHKIVQSRDSVIDISKVRKLGFEVSKPITAKDFL